MYQIISQLINWQINTKQNETGIDIKSTTLFLDEKISNGENKTYICDFTESPDSTGTVQFLLKKKFMKLNLKFLLFLTQVIKFF